MEITQSSFVKAYLSIGRFRGESSFKTWLYRIASNAWRNTIRDRSRRHHVDVDQVFLASGDNPHDEVVRNQEGKRLNAAPFRISPRSSRLKPCFDRPRKMQRQPARPRPISLPT